MPDYDLGRARGRIEIQHDERGYRRATQAQERLAESAEETAESFESAEKASADYEKQSRRTTKSIEDETESERKARIAREEATKAANRRKDAERELKDVLADQASTEEDVARATRNRSKAIGEHLKLAKEAKKAEREFREELEGVTQALDAIPDKKKVKLELDAKDAMSDLRKFNEQMQAARNAKRIAGSMFGPEKAIAKGGGMALGIGALSGLGGLLGAGGTGAIVNTIGGLVSVIADLSGVLGTLPGLLAGGASAMVTLKVATAGFGDALEAIMSGDSAAFAEALGELSANAQELFIQLNTLYPVIKEVGFAVQDAFTADLAEAVGPLAQTYFPMISTHLQNMASIMNWVIKDLVTWAMQNEVIQDFQHILSNIETAATNLAPSIRILADAFLDILSVSSDFLPQLANDFTGLATQFRDWIQELRDSGELHEWIRTGLDTFKQLLNVIKTFGQAFAGVFKIWEASAGGPLVMLQKLADTFNEWVSSAEGSSALAAFFSSLNTAIDAMMPVLKSFGTTLFGTILPTLADLGTQMAPGILSFFNSFGEAMKILAPYIVQLQGPLNTLLTALGETLVQVVQQIGPHLPEMFMQLSDAIIAILPYLPQMTKNLIELFDGVMQFAPGIMDDLGQIANAFLKFLAVTSTFRAGFVAAVTQIIVWLGKIGGAILNFLDNLIHKWPSDAGIALHGFFKNMGSQIAGGAQVAIDAFVDFFKGLGSQIAGGWNVLSTSLTEVKDKIWNWLKELPSKAYDAGKALVQDLIRGIRDWLGGLGDTAKDIVTTITDWLPGSPAKRGPLSGSGWTYRRGQSLAGDLASGIQDGAGSASKSAGGLAEAVSGALGMGKYGDTEGIHGFIKDMLQLTDFGSKIIDLFQSIADNVFKAFKFFTTDLATGESIFPKEWKRTVGEDVLRRQREDKAFQDAWNEQRKADKAGTDEIRPGPAGRELSTLPMDLTRNSSPEDVQKAIIAEGQRRGWSRQEIVAALSTARQESNFDPKALGGGGAWHGIFQQDTSYPGRDDPNKNIEAFFDRMDRMRNQTGRSDDPFENIFWLQQRPGESSAADALANGRRDYLDEISQWADAMGSVYDRLAGSASNANSAMSSVPKAGRPQAGTYGLPRGTDTGGYGTGTSAVFPPWVMALAKEFGVLPSTYHGHQETNRGEAGFAPNPDKLNRGIDWSGPVENMQKLADYLATVPGSLEQIIWRNPVTGRATELAGGRMQPGYYPEGTLSDHENHVHTRQSVPIPLPLSGNAVDVNIAGVDESARPGWFQPTLDDRQQAIQDQRDIAQSTGRIGEPVPVEVSGDGIPPGMVRGPDGRLQVAETAANTAESVSLEEQILSELRGQNASLDDAIRVGQDPNATDDQIAGTLGIIDQNIAALQNQDNPVARAQINALQGIQSEIAGNRGFTQQQQDPISTASNIAGGAFSIAQDVIGSINAGLKSIDAAATISSTLVRGIENTEDVMKIIDQVQVFIDFAARIAQTVSNISGTIGSLIGAGAGADPSGGAAGAAAAFQGVSAIAGIVSGTLQTINAAIDLGQEAYRITTKYLGKFLSYLVGGGEGSLMGDLRFLLDLNDNTLKAWSEDNPEDKRSHGIPPWMQDEYGQRNQTRERTPDLNLYIGPGTDPNDAMNAAMWEIKTGGQGVYAGDY